MPQVPQIDVHTLNEKLDSEDVTVIDIRDDDSYSAAHIPSAIPANNDNIQQLLKDLDKEKPVVVCCYHGISSMGAAGYFIQQGFQEVYSLSGGFEAWQMNYPSEP